MEEQLKIQTNSIEDFYNIGDTIGSGQFAVVKKVHFKSTSETFAAKFIKKKRSKTMKRGMTKEQFIREAEVLRSIDHKGVIYLHDAFEAKLEFVLVLELLSGGELFEFLSEQEFLTEDEAVGFLKQVIEAIQYLHDKSIVHLDIKPENIVLKEEKSSQIKLIDFGLARKLTDGEMVREIMGTPEFVAPEIIAFEDIGKETDMWAIGVLTYIMLSGASPFLGDDVNETFSNISMVDYEFDDEYFKDISECAKDFISALLVKNKRERMNAGECLNHEWMQDFDGTESAESASDSETEKDDLREITISPRQQGSLSRRRSTLIKTDTFKAFTARARWQKSVNKVIAISRLALLGKKNGQLQRNKTSDGTTNTPTNPEPNDKDCNTNETNVQLTELNAISDVEAKNDDVEAKNDDVLSQVMAPKSNTLDTKGIRSNLCNERSTKENDDEDKSYVEATGLKSIDSELPVTGQDKQVIPVITGHVADVRSEESSNKTVDENVQQTEKRKRSLGFEFLMSKFSNETSEKEGTKPNGQSSFPTRTNATESKRISKDDHSNTKNSTLLDSVGNRKSSTKNEILKWEKKSFNGPRSSTRQPLGSNEQHRISLPVMSDVKKEDPKGHGKERYSLGDAKEIIAQNTSSRVKSATQSTEIFIQQPVVPRQRHVELPELGLGYTSVNNKTSITRQHGDNVINTAMIDQEHAFVVKTNLQENNDSDSYAAGKTTIDGGTAEYGGTSEEGETADEGDSSKKDSAKSGTERRVSSAFIDYKLGNTAMEGFSELSLTLQKSSSSPGENQDQFVWVVTTEKNQRREFLSRILAPKVQAAKKAALQGDIFEKRRIRHKPIGEKGPPKTRSVSTVAPPMTSPAARKHHSVPSGPTVLTLDGTNVPTVQLSSNMPELSFKIKMGDDKRIAGI